MADKTIPQLPRLDESPAPEDLIIVQDVSDGANGTTKAVTRADFGGVQSVAGDGVGGTAANPVLTFPTAGEIGAIPASEKGAANGVATLGADGVLVEDTDYAFYYVPGYYYDGGGAAQTTASLPVSQFTAHGILRLIYTDVDVDRIAMEVVTNGGLDSTCRVGIYTVNQSTGVRDLIAGSEVVFDTSSNGVKIATVDITIPKGLVEILFINQTGVSSVVYRAASGRASVALIDEARLGLAFNNSKRFQNGSNIPSVLPTTVAASITDTSVTFLPPIIWLRAKV